SSPELVSTGSVVQSFAPRWSIAGAPVRIWPVVGRRHSRLGRWLAPRSSRGRRWVAALDPESSQPLRRHDRTSLGAIGNQTSESGDDAFFLVMNSLSASSMPGSIGGASYSASIRFQILFARWGDSSAPSSSHCSNELLSAVADR